MLRNLMLTMLLGGLWHGANWTFVIWGGLHGLYLSADRLLHGSQVPKDSRLPWKILKIVATFHLVVLTWLFFRAESLSAATSYLVAMTHLGSPLVVRLLVVTVFYFLFMAAIDYPLYKADTEVLPIRAERWLARGLSYGTLTAVILFLGEPYAQPFIYFQF